MADKKAGKDILKDVLTGDHDHNIPGFDELTKLIAKQTKPQPPPQQPPAKKPPRRKATGAKKKTTHYLSEEVFENLGEARDTIENLLPDEIATHVTKSGIVDTALKMILQELADKGEKSVLFKQIIKDKKDK